MIEYRPQERPLAYYFKSEGQRYAVERFIEIAKEEGIIGDLYWPNKDKAPWHLQATVGKEKMNFWPHVMKSHVEYTKDVAVGFKAMRAMIRAAKIGEEDDDFDVFDDG